MSKTETRKNIKSNVECQYFDIDKKICTHPNYSLIDSKCRVFVKGLDNYGNK